MPSTHSLSHGRSIFLIGMLGAASIACSTLTNITREATNTPNPSPTFPPASSVVPEPTDVPAPASGADAVPGSILFEDDFSSQSSGWDQFEDDEGSTDYFDSGYRISVEVESTFYWANPGRSFDDVRVEVDAVLTSGEEDNQLGIICRHSDIDNFYAAVISSDGYYAFRKRLAGADLEIMGGDSFQTNGHINQGPDVTNHIRVDCIGDTITLYVNGQFVDDIQNGDITSGDVGLLAGTFSALSTEILFDNLVVYQP